MKTLVLIYMLASGPDLYAVELEADECRAYMARIEQTGGPIPVSISGMDTPQTMVLASCVSPESFFAQYEQIETERAEIAE